MQERSSLQHCIHLKFQEECWWKCKVHQSTLPVPQTLPFAVAAFFEAKIIKDLNCLRDCFPELGKRRGGKKKQKARGKERQEAPNDSDTTCISSLLDDVLTKGTCNSIFNNPAAQLAFLNATNIIWNFDTLKKDCETENLDEWSIADIAAVILPDIDGLQTDLFQCPIQTVCPTIDLSKITKGTCSESTEKLLLEDPKCKKAIDEQPSTIRDTLHNLIAASCKYEAAAAVDAGNTFNFLDQYLNTQNRQDVAIDAGDIKAGTKTQINFNNTKHRYPWICSLRRTGISAEHLCAVTVLSVPPQPTIIVGAAHCTYLCKNGGPAGRMLDSCCCSPEPLGCSGDISRCGTNPGAAEMNAEEATIICGEWNTGATQPKFSEEEYNVALEITEIVRHPNFDPQLGVERGNDLAIFKVKSGELEKSQAEGIEINPICLPEPNRLAAEEGVHSGWGKPPPLQYFEEYGPGYLSFITDTFKQWHFKMDISKECKDEEIGSIILPSAQCPVPLNEDGECPLTLEDFLLGLSAMFPDLEKYLTSSRTSYYPPGLICARELSKKFCPTSGHSGSPLMVRRQDNK